MNTDRHRSKRPAIAVALSLAAILLFTRATTYSAADNQTTPAYPPVPGDGSYTFAETGKTVTGIFLQYWQDHGGLMQQGYPISDPVEEVSDLDGKLYTVQYFERSVLEYHPENQSPYNILLSQLGTFQYKKKYPNGAPNQTVNGENARFFSETGHSIGGRFREYWESNGGLMQQGYPISDEFQEESDLNGQTYLVQYFERAVFEYHPENVKPYDVLLSQLGKFQHDADSGTALTAPEVTASGCWTHYTESFLNTSDSYLTAIDARANDDIWAVGDVGIGPRYSDTYHLETLTMHWDGRKWKRLPSPSIPWRPGSADSDRYLNKLVGISADSANDAWAIGSEVILHWDGQTWKEVYRASGLSGIAAISPDDVWVVGTLSSALDTRYLILHWDGKDWTRIQNMHLAGGADQGVLRAVKAFSPTDVWAVGCAGKFCFDGPSNKPVAFHWDGKQWSGTLIRSNEDYVELNALDGASSHDLWAVGARGPNGADFFTVHWDGTTWTPVNAPPPEHWPDSGGPLRSVAALKGDDVWSVGLVDPPTGNAGNYAFLEHWDGRAWNGRWGSEDDSELDGATKVNGDFWAVGGNGALANVAGATILRHAAGCVDPTPEPTPTNIPYTPISPY